MSRDDRVNTSRWPNQRCALLALGGLLTLCPLPAAAQSTPVAGDMFGYSVAAGDFNGDGIDDVAVGILGKDVGGSTDSGAVEIHYGVTGTGPMTTQWLDEKMLSQSNVAPSEQFGFALAAGDFNADGRDDLAIGVPREQLGFITPNGIFAVCGAVYVVYGSASGLDLRTNQVWYRGGGLPGVAGGDLLGHTLATGNFGGDAADDLAIAAAGQDFPSAPDAGTVYVVFGRTGVGLNEAQPAVQTINQSTPGIADDPEVSENFGFTLAAGDFRNDDVYDDLVIGVTGETVAGFYAGAIHVLHGAVSGLQASGAQFFTQNDLGEVGETSDFFGRGLATGDFDGNGTSDLAVGASKERLTAFSQGMLHVIYATPGVGLVASSVRSFNQDSPGVPSVATSNEQFGYALAAGDFNGDGKEDLAVGVPYDSQAVSRGGALNLFLGSAGGLTPYNGIFHQNTADVEGDAESDDAFASALCTGDFDGDGFIDVAVGAWGDRAAGPLQSGAVNIIEGRPIPPLTALEGRLLTE